MNTEELSSCFEFLGIKPSDDVLIKCGEMCITHKVSSEDLVDQWVAYTASHLSGAPPTVDSLNAMEQKEYIKGQNKEHVSAKKTPSTPRNVRVYGSAEADIDMEATESIVNSYNCSTPQSSKKPLKRVRSPDEQSKSKKLQFTGATSSPRPSFAPTSYSPLAASQSTSYADRTDSGKVVLSFGSRDLFKTASFQCSKTNNEYRASVRQWGEQEDWLSSDARYMYEVMGAKAESLSNVSTYLGHSLIKKYALDPPESFTKPWGEITTFGRICCDSDGKLNTASVLLEGTQQLANGHTITLNLSKVPSYTIFPGQTVAVQGSILNTSTLLAQKLFFDATPNLPTELPRFPEPLQVVVAAGPFTLSDNLLYEPLDDLLKYVADKKPHVLIIIGPVVDVSHDSIKDGTLAETFDTFFETLVDMIMASVKELHTQVVLLASQKDAHHQLVYPTPPYNNRKKYANLHCVPDPCLLNIDGLVIGATTTDVLFHAGKEELCYPPSTGDRMARLASHILGQQSFYPLYPPDIDMCVDHELLEKHAILDVTPHILVLPSSLRYFIKNIKGCVVVNPERLVKGYVGGTFARLEIRPGDIGTLSDNIACQIVQV